MEPDAQATGGVGPAHKVLWHSGVKDDLEKVAPSEVERLVRAAEYRLSRAPEFIGQPLKGTTRLLWKLRFGKYRIVYTLNSSAKEVWVLSIQTRDIVYRPSHLESLLKLAIALREQEGKGSH